MISLRHRFLVGFGILQVLLAVTAVWRGVVRLNKTASAGQVQRLRDKAWIAGMALAEGVSTNQLREDPRLELESLELALEIEPAVGEKPGDSSPRLMKGVGTMGDAEVGAEWVVRTAREGWVRLRVEPASVLGSSGQRRRMLTLVFGGTVYVVLSIGAAAWMTRRWLGALARMSEVASRLATGSVPMGRLPVPEMEGELAAFASTLNALLDRLETEYANRNRFLADAAHELRTPLTSLRTEIDVVLRRERDPERYKHVLESNRVELVRLSGLIDGLLTLARADAGEVLQQREACDLQTLAREAVARSAVFAAERGVKLVLADGIARRAVVDSVAIGRILDNLLSNAVVNTEAGGTVTVEIRAEDGVGEVEVMVNDTGCGIPSDQTAKVFERFYRVDARKVGGTGLGLAIVKALVEAHGGRVSLESVVGVGTRVNVRLPVG